MVLRLESGDVREIFWRDWRLVVAEDQWAESDSSDDEQQTMTLFPAGTTFFAPDDIHQVTVQFPDADSAIVFYEWMIDLSKGDGQEYEQS